MHLALKAMLQPVWPDSRPVLPHSRQHRPVRLELCRKPVNDSLETDHVLLRGVWIAAFRMPANS
eukprot:3811335-Amphidinium_carterae.1